MPRNERIKQVVVKGLVEGGRAGAPEDRVPHLVVQKAVRDLSPDAVRVLLWYHGHEEAVALDPVADSEPSSTEVRP